MTRVEQAKLAASLSGSILREFIAAVEDGRVPEDWDGIEIRQWLYEQYRREWLGLVKRTLSLRTKRGQNFRSARYNRSF